MLYGNKRVENRVSKTTRNYRISFFAGNDEKRARCVSYHQPSAVHKFVKCNVHASQPFTLKILHRNDNS